MEWIRGYENFSPVPGLVLTDGTFDGVHTGHQAILNRVVQLAKNKNGKSAVLTYWPHPRIVLQPQAVPLAQLTSLEEKAARFEAAGIDFLIVIPFTKSFSQITWRDFIHVILHQRLQADTVVVGYDHRFGRNREGDYTLLVHEAQQFGIAVEEIPKQVIDAIAVSSTKIRNALASGEVKTANAYLGYPYELTAKVEYGQQIGRTIGFPTANLKPCFEHKLIPADGVYAVRVHVADATYPGMLNIGFRPTVSGMGRTIEVHIFNFNTDIYEQSIKVQFIDFIRREQKFDNLESLKAQLMKDKEHISKCYFS